MNGTWRPCNAAEHRGARFPIYGRFCSHCSAWEDRVLLGPHRKLNIAGSTFLKTARASPCGDLAPDPDLNPKRNLNSRGTRTPMRSKRHAVPPCMTSKWSISPETLNTIPASRCVFGSFKPGKRCLSHARRTAPRKPATWVSLRGAGTLSEGVPIHYGIDFSDGIMPEHTQRSDGDGVHLDGRMR